MKNGCLLFVFFIFGIVGVEGQCPPGDINFYSQADIDNFAMNYPGCTEVFGGVEISGSGISNLSGLTQITSIDGWLFIYDAGSITNLSGLDNLNAVGGLFIHENASLSNLSGLNSLTSIGEMLDIQNNNALLGLSGLDVLTSIGTHLNVSSNGALVSLNGLDNLTSIGTALSIFFNGSLISLSGLNNVISVGGSLHINSNGSLTSLSGLDNLLSVSGLLAITDNGSLASISSLYKVISINGNLAITNNGSLVNLNGLDNIDHTTIMNLFIQNSPNLSLCEVPSICNYLDIPGNPADISGNAPNCIDRSAVEAACLLVLPIDLISFTSRDLSGSTQLTWRTASEINNDHFKIEHSRNGYSFETLGKVAGKGTTVQSQDYQFIHTGPVPGTHYYRLKQVDFDGNFTYSDIISVSLKNDDISFYPNPTTGVIQISGKDLENAEYLVTDIAGRVLLENKHAHGQVDISSLPKGCYLVTLRTGDEEVVERVWKE